MKRFNVILFSTIFLLLSCRPEAPKEKPLIVTSISVYEDMVRQIVGSSCDVQSLITGMDNPHTFDISGSEIQAVNSADLLIFNGLGLESWADQIISGIDTTRTEVLFVGDQIQDSPLLIHGDNPHIWMDPRIGRTIAETLVPILQQVLPDSQEVFQRRADQYLVEIDELIEDIQFKLESLEGAQVIAQTPGLDYFFSAFGIQRTDVIVEHPGTEPSARHMAALADLLETGNIIAIVRLPQFSERLPQTLGDESGVAVKLMSPLINGAPYVDNYVDLIWFNADAFSDISPEGV